MKKAGLANIEKTGNMTHEEVDAVIEFMIERKKDGQFRAIWEDYGQCVNLLASGEIWLADAWNPVVEDVKKQGCGLQIRHPQGRLHRLVPRGCGRQGHAEPGRGASTT